MRDITFDHYSMVRKTAWIGNVWAYPEFIACMWSGRATV